MYNCQQSADFVQMSNPEAVVTYQKKNNNVLTANHVSDW